MGSDFALSLRNIKNTLLFSRSILTPTVPQPDHTMDDCCYFRQFVIHMAVPSGDGKILETGPSLLH